VLHPWLAILLRRLDTLGFRLDARGRSVRGGKEPPVSWRGDGLSLGRGEVLMFVDEPG